MRGDHWGRGGWWPLVARFYLRRWTMWLVRCHQVGAMFFHQWIMMYGIIVQQILMLWIGRNKTAKIKYFNNCRVQWLIFTKQTSICAQNTWQLDATSITYSDRNCECHNGMRLLRQEVSTGQRSLRVILILCMVPLIVKLTYNYCVLLYKQLRVKCSTRICNKSLSLLATVCMCHM